MKNLLLVAILYIIASILICLIFFINDSLSLTATLWGYWVGIILSAILFYDGLNEELF